MRRSHRILVLALVMALIASFAVPMTAAAGSGGSGSDFSSETEFSETDEFSETTTEDFSTDASVDEYPREGIASGGGSMASGGPSPLPLLLSAGVFALLATGSWGLKGRLRG